MGAHKKTYFCWALVMYALLDSPQALMGSQQGCFCLSHPPPGAPPIHACAAASCTSVLVASCWPYSPLVGLLGAVGALRGPWRAH